MATYEYSVSGQSITTTKAGRLVSGTVGIYTVKFTFDSSWDGLEKWASFDPNPGQAYKQPLDANGECEIPGEVMGGVQLRIGAFGIADGQAYPTVWANKLSLEEGCFVEIPISDWPEPAPVIEGILEELENKVDKPASAIAGNVAIFDNNESIADSGVSKDNLILAPQLTSHIYAEDQTPYLYRQTGGGVEAGTREYDSIVGGSVVWNQTVPEFSAVNWRSESGVTSTYSDGVVTITSTTARNGILTQTAFQCILNHKYLITADFFAPEVIRTITFGFVSGSGAYMQVPEATPNQWMTASVIRNCTAASRNMLVLYSAQASGYSGLKVRNGAIMDLTDMFGTAVADRLYAMETASAGSGIAVLNAMGLNQYYPYTAEPSLLSAMPTAHKMTDADGNVIGNYPLAGIELRGVPAVDSGGNIYFDGDTYAPDGTVVRRYAVKTIDGTEAGWYKSSTRNGSFYLAMGAQNYKSNGNVICAKLITVHSLSNYAVGCLYPDYNDISFWFADGVGKTLEQFKAWLSSNPFVIIYEVKTPTTETADPYDALQICDPLGTEEYVDNRSIPVPVGGLTKYPVDQVRKLDGLPSDFSTLIAPTEKTYTATRAYAVGRLLIVDNQLYKAQTAIASGATLTVGTNIVATTLDEVIASL